MSARENLLEELEYRLVLIASRSRKVLVVPTGEGYHLPTAHIPQGVRIAKELQKAIGKIWSLDVIFLDLLPSEDDYLPCAIAEVTCSPRVINLVPVGMEDLLDIDLGGVLLARLAAACKGNSLSNSPFSRIGWIDQAIAWLKAATGKRLTSKSQIEQYNAGAQFALLRLAVDSYSVYWLKAILGPGECELPVTQALVSLYPQALPVVLSVNQEWGAWLMADAGKPLAEGSDLAILQQAVGTMAELQRHTVGYTNLLLDLGGLDRSPRVLQSRCEELFVHMEEAMAQPTSVKAPRLTPKRLRQMERLAEDVCLRLDDLVIPDAIVHGDMNRGNLVYDGCQCRFIDWREAYIGNPFVTLEHLLLLSTSGAQDRETSSLKETYVQVWSDLIPEWRIRRALKLTPVVAALSALYGRADWLHSERRNSPARLRYARNIARHLDRALRSSELFELRSSPKLSVCTGAPPRKSQADLVAHSAEPRMPAVAPLMEGSARDLAIQEES